MSSIKLILTLIVLALSVPSWLQAEGTLPVIKGIRVFRSGDNLGVEISADKSFEYTCTKMPQLLKLVVDLPRTELGVPETVYKYKGTNISRIWLEKKTINDVKVTRVSVHLIEDTDFSARIDPLDSKKLTILLHKPAPAASVAAAKTAASETAAKTAASGTAASRTATSGAAASGAAASRTIAAKPGVAHPEKQPSAQGPSAPVAPAATVARKPLEPGSSQPITVTGVIYGVDSIEIKASGNIGEYKVFTLLQPGRLVLDIPGAQTTLRPVAVPANRFGVTKTRFGLSEGKLRIVFETGTQPFPGYEVVKTGAGLRVLLRRP